MKNTRLKGGFWILSRQEKDGEHEVKDGENRFWSEKKWQNEFSGRMVLKKREMWEQEHVY